MAPVPQDRVQMGSLTPGQAERVLMEPMADGYRPNLPIYATRDEYWNPFDFMWDLESMLRHDCITTPLSNVMAPIAQMQVEFEASSTRVAKFLVSEWEKWLDRFVPAVRESGYPYGWAGGEVIYTT